MDFSDITGLQSVGHNNLFIYNLFRVIRIGKSRNLLVQWQFLESAEGTKAAVFEIPS